MDFGKCSVGRMESRGREFGGKQDIEGKYFYFVWGKERKKG
jgi:hypothetical protein